MYKIIFAPRWREELLATSEEGTLIFEITMGKLHVYFPEHDRWLSTAPEWAKDKWQLFYDACTAWCKENRIPLTLVPDAYINEEKKS